MVKLSSWRKEAGKEMRWGKRWSYTFYFKKADRVKLAQTMAEAAERKATEQDGAEQDGSNPASA